MGHPSEMCFAPRFTNFTGQADFQDYTDFLGFFLELMIINSRKEIIPLGEFNESGVIDGD